jgi:hypothetical protein
LATLALTVFGFINYCSMRGGQIDHLHKSNDLRSGFIPARKNPLGVKEGSLNEVKEQNANGTKPPALPREH